MTTETLNIPKALVYEEDEGKPIYYKGYKKVLSGELNTESIMGASYIQSLTVMLIVDFLLQNLDRKKYFVLFNELGVHLGKGKNRACDIAIYEREKLKDVADAEKYLNIPPLIAFEIDIKADLEDTNAQSYYQKKTQQLLDFGVEKLIWITTDTRKIMVATPNAPWLITDWTEDVTIREGLVMNLSKLSEML